jgi:hypothetical protein
MCTDGSRTNICSNKLLHIHIYTRNTCLGSSLDGRLARDDYLEVLCRRPLALRGPLKVQLHVCPGLSLKWTDAVHFSMRLYVCIVCACAYKVSQSESASVTISRVYVLKDAHESCVHVYKSYVHAQADTRCAPNARVCPCNSGTYRECHQQRGNLTESKKQYMRGTTNICERADSELHAWDRMWSRGVMRSMGLAPCSSSRRRKRPFLADSHAYARSRHLGRKSASLWRNSYKHGEHSKCTSCMPCFPWAALHLESPACARVCARHSEQWRVRRYK